MFELSRRNNQPAEVYNPFREMEDFERHFFADPFGSFFNSQDLMEFKADVTDEGDHFLVEADLPGFDKKDIHLDLSGDVLTIRAERRSSAKEKDKKGKVLRMERSYGSYSRQFNVSEIDTDHIKAAYHHGVLSLTLPKKNEVIPQSRRLEIE